MKFVKFKSPHGLSSRVIFVLLIAIVSSVSALAETLKGRVLDESELPLVGATVKIAHPKRVVVTDAEGWFRIPDVRKDIEVEVSYIGYSAEKRNWKGGELVITMKPLAQSMDEVVVIGYATVKKRDLTGAVSAVGADQLGSQRSPSLTTALQGTMPGLNVSRSGSMPGSSGTMTIRGITTLSDNNPLILVDGMPVGSLDMVNPDDVQQISVLKDAAAASIYGARAAAGVILVTTKSAKEGDLNISYSGEVSMIQAASMPEFITEPQEWMRMFNELTWNDAGNPENGQYAVFSPEVIEDYYQLNAIDPLAYPDYDWIGSIMKPWAPRTKHTLSMSYGNKQIKSRVSTSYERSEALYDGNDFNRIYLRANNEIKFNNNWSANFDMAVRHHVKNDPNFGSPIRAANMYPRYYIGRYPDGRWAPGQSGANTEARFRDGGTTTSTGDNLAGKMSLTYRPISTVTIQASVAPNMTFSKTKDMQKAIPYYDYEDPGKRLGFISGYGANKLTESRAEAVSFEKSLIASYVDQLGNHSLNAMVGYEDYTYNHESMSAVSDQMTLSNYPYLDLANTNYLSVAGSAYEHAYQSVFGRVMYNYDGRYFLQANVRGDASSRFHKNHRWGVFPSGSLGWRVTNERFMESLQPTLSNLMLRASYGSLGNERIGNYPYQSTINLTNAVMIGNSGFVSQTAGAQVEYAVTDLTWESTHTWDLGIDLGMFNNRLDLTADIYYKQTKNMLLAMAIPQFTGYSSPQINAGDMNTRGWEVKIGWHDNIGSDWRYSASFNLSDSKSMMGDLGGKVMYSGDCIIKGGEEYMAYYGYRALGLFQSKEEADASPKLLQSATAGDLKYKDLSGVDGNPDGVIEKTYDREVLGSSLPHFLYGGNLSIGWKGLELSAAFSGVGKQNAYYSQSMVKAMESGYLGAPAIMRGKYWSHNNTPEQNAAAIYPRLSRELGNNYTPTSDWWIFNGAYFRMKNVNISYVLPSTLTKQIRFNRIRVFCNVEDPFQISHYPKGWDPEINSNGGNYIARTYTFGLDFSF